MKIKDITIKDWVGITSFIIVVVIITLGFTSCSTSKYTIHQKTYIKEITYDTIYVVRTQLKRKRDIEYQLVNEVDKANLEEAKRDQLFEVNELLKELTTE